VITNSSNIIHHWIGDCNVHNYTLNKPVFFLSRHPRIDASLSETHTCCEHTPVKVNSKLRTQKLMTLPHEMWFYHVSILQKCNHVK